MFRIDIVVLNLAVSTELSERISAWVSWVSSCWISKKIPRHIGRNKSVSLLKSKIVSCKQPSCLRLQCFSYWQGRASSSKISYSLPSPARDLAPTSLLELIQLTTPVVGRNTPDSSFNRRALFSSTNSAGSGKGDFHMLLTLLLQLAFAERRWAEQRASLSGTPTVSTTHSQ